MIKQKDYKTLTSLEVEYAALLLKDNTDKEDKNINDILHITNEVKEVPMEYCKWKYKIHLIIAKLIMPNNIFEIRMAYALDIQDLIYKYAEKHIRPSELTDHEEDRIISDFQNDIKLLDKKGNTNENK